MTSGKIHTLESFLSAIRSGGGADGLVLTYGQYDALHIGHIRHLNQARRMGTALAVVLTPDLQLDRRNGSPMPADLRAELLASLSFVDYVITDAPPLRETLKKVRPAVYAAMPEPDSDAPTADEEAACREAGVRHAVTEGVAFNSTRRINQFLSGFSEEVRQYLEVFRTRYGGEDVARVLEAMGSLRVAVIGDTIVDEYCYCNTLGASSKDPILALRYQSSDLFAGGIVAVANHVANFASRVDLFTVLGERNSHREFIESNLNPAIRPHFQIQDGAPTVVKRRYVEGYTQNKLFEIYFMEDDGLEPDKDRAFRDQVAEALPDYDLIVVADFGHGAISPEMRTLLTRKAPFLAVNAQANSGNRGFHTITKYDRADYVSIAEHEIRLEMRDMRGSVGQMIDTLAARLGSTNFVVTRGKRGSVIRGANGGHVQVPAFAQKIVDRIGAGDAFLSVTSLAARLNTPPELLCFIGNVVGALAVEILGNQKSIDKASVQRYAASLLD